MTTQLLTKQTGPIYLDRHGLEEEFGIRFNAEYLSRLIKKGGFPVPILLGPKKKAWRRDDIEQWLANRPTAI